MKWGSLAEFLAMGGYGFYVWGSFLAAAAFMLVEPVLLVMRRKTAIKELKGEIAARVENHETEK